jgi:hypothetical protein
MAAQDPVVLHPPIEAVNYLTHDLNSVAEFDLIWVRVRARIAFQPRRSVRLIQLAASKSTSLVEDILYAPAW